MIIYNVTISVEAHIHDEWLRWMREEHIPDVMATGLFLDSRMVRVLSEEDAGLTYAVQYTCADMSTYDRYWEAFAPALQAKTLARFGDRFVTFRTLLEVVHTA